MKLNIQRKDGITSFELFKENEILLNQLIEIKKDIDSSLGFRCGCKSGVCGSCAVKVNGVERLACKTKIKDGDLIEPIKNTKVIKDLIVDLSYESDRLKSSKAFLEEYQLNEITKKDEKLIDIQSNCILCQSCYSSCPIYDVNENFIGPYALTRTLRYVNDKKENNIKDKLDTIQQNGIWDCTLCGNCTMVCPQHIDPKMDIINLRNISAQHGYSDPNMMNFNNNMDIGFNPNGF